MLNLPFFFLLNFKLQSHRYSIISIGYVYIIEFSVNVSYSKFVEFEFDQNQQIMKTLRTMCKEKC